MAGKPTPIFYLAVLLVIAALVGFAMFNAGDILAPGGNGPGGSGHAGGASDSSDDDIDIKDLVGAESPDEAGITTVSEYEYKPSERLPPVTGTAGYKPLQDNTVRFAINVWAGWAPIIQANNGLAPGKIWRTADGKEFKLELVLIDDPISMLSLIHI